jgi:hypothetical protein
MRKLMARYEFYVDTSGSYSAFQRAFAGTMERVTMMRKATLSFAKMLERI